MAKVSHLAVRTDIGPCVLPCVVVVFVLRGRARSAMRVGLQKFHAVQGRLGGQRDLNSDASSRGLAGPYPALRLRDGAAARRNTYTV